MPKFNVSMRVRVARFRTVRFCSRLAGWLLILPSVISLALAEWFRQFADDLIDWRSEEELSNVEHAELNEALHATPIPPRDGVKQLLDRLSGVSIDQRDPVVPAIVVSDNSNSVSDASTPVDSSGVSEELELAAADKEPSDEEDEPPQQEGPISSDVAEWRRCVDDAKRGFGKSASKRWLARSQGKKAA